MTTPFAQSEHDQVQHTPNVFTTFGKLTERDQSRAGHGRLALASGHPTDVAELKKVRKAGELPGLAHDRDLAGVLIEISRGF
jgi:hypothetical protein